MLPSATVITGFSGFTMSAFSLMTSATRLPLAALIVSCTNIIDSIIRALRIVIT